MEEAQAETKRCDCEGKYKPYFLRSSEYYLCLDCGAQYPATPEEIQDEFDPLEEKRALLREHGITLIPEPDAIGEFKGDIVWSPTPPKPRPSDSPAGKWLEMCGWPTYRQTHAGLIPERITAADLEPVCPEHDEPMILGFCPECNEEE
jgi:hypothetical protein